MGTPFRMATNIVEGIEVCSIDGHDFLELPSVYTKHKMPISQQHIPTQSDMDQWEHMKDVDIQKINADVGLLIGNNVPDAYSPIEIRTGPSQSPHATKSRLGWIPWNVVRKSQSSHDKCYPVHRIDVTLENIEEDIKLE